MSDYLTYGFLSTDAETPEGRWTGKPARMGFDLRPEPCEAWRREMSHRIKACIREQERALCGPLIRLGIMPKSFTA